MWNHGDFSDFKRLIPKEVLSTEQNKYEGQSLK
jgi:hypothetical protein